MLGRHDRLNCNWMTQDGFWPKTILLLLKTYSQLLEKRWWKSIFGANLAGPSLFGYKLHKCIQAVSFKGSVIGSGWCQNFQTSLIWAINQTGPVSFPSDTITLKWRVFLVCVHGGNVWTKWRIEDPIRDEIRIKQPTLWLMTYLLSMSRPKTKPHVHAEFKAELRYFVHVCKFFRSSD